MFRRLRWSALRWSALDGEGGEPKPHKMSEVCFKIRTMEGEVLEVALVHPSCSDRMGQLHPWERGSFPERGDYLASCSGLCELPSNGFLSWVCLEKSFIYYGVDIPLLCCAWYSVSLNKDPHWKRGFPSWATAPVTDLFWHRTACWVVPSGW